MRVAFDIGGVLSKYPNQFRELILKIVSHGLGHWPAMEVFIISDMHPKEKIVELLRLNRIDGFSYDNVYCADYDTHGDGCKAELLDQLKIDLFFDDHIGYVATSIPGTYPTIRCLVWPEAGLPYRADSWIVPDGEPEFGRKTYYKMRTP
jgi:hypothetical protein